MRRSPTPLVCDATIMGGSSFPTQRAAAVTAPTLVIYGGAGSEWMAETADALAAVPALA